MVLEDWWRKKMYVKTFKKTSKDSSRGNQYMTQSLKEVFDFDSITRGYLQDRAWNDQKKACCHKLRGRVTTGTEVCSSNDVLVFQMECNKMLFVEFKNGRVDKNNIHKKIECSNENLKRILGEDSSFIKDNVSYLLVYNLQQLLSTNVEEDFVISELNQDSDNSLYIKQSLSRKTNGFVEIPVGYGLKKYEHVFEKLRSLDADIFNRHVDSLTPDYFLQNEI